jgi:hypothetical protein
MLLYIEANAKLCKPQNAIIIGMLGLVQSFKFWPTELPVSDAIPHYESAFIIFPSSSLTLPNPIYFLMVDQAQPDIPELIPIWTPDNTAPHRNPITKAGPPAIPMRTIGPINYIK